MVLRARGRERSPADVLRLLLGLALLGLGLLATTVARNTVGGIEADIVEGYDHVPERIAEVATALAFVLAAAAPLLAILVLVVRRRYRRALALLLGGYLASWMMIGLDRALIGTGFPYRANLHWLDDYMAMLKAVTQATAGIRRPGAAALDLAYVAAGRLDAFWELGLSPWDTAAGTLLITEAGGFVGTLNGGEYKQQGDIVALEHWGSSGFANTDLDVQLKQHGLHQLIVILGNCLY